MSQERQQPRLLFISRRLPWPLHGGAALRNYWTLVALSNRYVVDVFATVDGRQAEARLPLDLGTAAVFRRPSDFSLVRRVADSLLAGVPFFAAGQVPEAMRSAVRHAVTSRQYCAAHVAELAAALALPRDLRIPVIYDAHNCEYQLLRRRAGTEAWPLRPLILAEAHRVFRLERSVLRRAKLVTATSRQDVDDLARIAPEIRARTVVVPNGVDVNAYAECRSRSPRPGTLLATGSFCWRPNYQGLQWFLREVLPTLRSRRGEVEVRVAGRMTETQARDLARLPGVRPVPNPEDVRPELARAQVVLVPVLASSGTRLRITEAWAAGRPVVTTTAGALGIDVSLAGRALLVADCPEGFAGSIRLLLDDPTLWQRVREAGLQQAAACDWTRVGHRLLEWHDSVLGTGSPPNRLEGMA
jgi:glycosyltransferase involved in cell wall biosynthesis